MGTPTASSRSKHREGMETSGIPTSDALGVSMPELRRLAKTMDEDASTGDSLRATGLREEAVTTAEGSKSGKTSGARGSAGRPCG